MGQVESILIRKAEPGDAGYVAYMHGRYYHKYHGFYEGAEYYFIKYLADFVHESEGGRLWVAEVGGVISGSVGIVRVDSDTAQFRWFFVEKVHQNKGIGSELMKTALDFCRENNYTNIFLWTFKGLDTARRLYDKAGFMLAEEKPNNGWSSATIIEQKMELKLKRKLIGMSYSFVAKVELFEREKGWHYVSVPTELSKPLEHLADRGLIAVTSTVGNTSWPTSLLPMGDGTHFIALPARVRSKEKLALGEEVEVSFETVQRIRYARTKGQVK